MFRICSVCDASPDEIHHDGLDPHLIRPVQIETTGLVGCVILRIATTRLGLLIILYSIDT